MKQQLIYAGIFAFVALILAPRIWLRNKELPFFDKPLPFYNLQNVWSKEELHSLQEFMKSGSFKTMPRNTDIREKEIRLEPYEDGTCVYDYLVNVNNACVPIGRMDSLIHLAKFGGIDGFKESVRDLMNTVHVFQMFQFGQELQRPEIKKFMKSEDFEKAAKEVCGNEFPFRKEVQVNMNILLPGQLLPMHYDVPYFHKGGIVEHFPLWLLAVMQESGLYDDDIPPHVQGQAYLSFNESIVGGKYFFYPQGPGGQMKMLDPVPNSAILVDGSRVMHGVSRIDPSRKAPPLYEQPAVINYNAKIDKWEVKTTQDKLLATYESNDLRMTFIWRSLCFKTEKERDNWNPKVPMYKINDVLQDLENDLRKRGVLAKNHQRPDHFEFALMLIDEYIRYPVASLDNSLIPYNYCMLPYLVENRKLRSILKHFMDFIC